MYVNLFQDIKALPVWAPGSNALAPNALLLQTPEKKERDVTYNITVTKQETLKISFYHLRSLKQHSDMSLFLITSCLHASLPFEQMYNPWHNFTRQMISALKEITFRRSHWSWSERSCSAWEPLQVCLHQSVCYHDVAKLLWAQDIISTVISVIKLRRLSSNHKNFTHCYPDVMYAIKISKRRRPNSVIAMTESRWL